jgi:hypothetical protein
MKKIGIVVVLVVVLVFALTACGGKTPLGGIGDILGGSASGSADTAEDKIDLSKAADELVSDAIEGDAFTEKAAAQALKMKGVDESAIVPDWDWTIDESKMMAYGDTSHGTIAFTRKSGETTEEEYTAWLKKVFDATVAVSDDGHNIQGFSWGDGDVEKTWDEFIGSESMIQTWSYKYKGEIMDVYVEQVEDPDQDSEYLQDESGQWYWIYHNIGVSVDIATGLQKSWDESMADLEQAFEEHGDEIEEALKEYTN